MSTTMQIHRHPDEDGSAGEGSVAFTLTKPVDLALLDAELTERMNWRKPSGLVASGDLSAASEDEPVTLWVMREDVEPRTLQSVVHQHEVPEEPVDRLTELREKARTDEGLTEEETSEAVRLLLLA